MIMITILPSPQCTMVQTVACSKHCLSGGRGMEVILSRYVILKTASINALKVTVVQVEPSRRVFVVRSTRHIHRNNQTDMMKCPSIKKVGAMRMRTDLRYSEFETFLPNKAVISHYTKQLLLFIRFLRILKKHLSFSEI